MFDTFTPQLLELFATSLWETVVMVGVSGAVGALLGLPLGDAWQARWTPFALLPKAVWR